MPEYTEQWTVERYEAYVAELTADPVIVVMASSIPQDAPLHRFFHGEDAVTERVAEIFDFAYDLGLMQEGRRGDAERPIGAVLDAVRRVGQELGVCT